MPKEVMLETYGEEKKKNLWDKTKEWFNNKLEEKREEKEIQNQIKKEAIAEAKKELIPILKEKYKKEHIDKITGRNKGEKMEKLKNAFRLSGSDGGFLASDEKINRMLGKSSDNSTNNDKISMMLGKKTEKKDCVEKTTLSNEEILNTLSLKRKDDKEEKIKSLNGSKSETSTEDKIKMMLGKK